MPEKSLLFYLEMILDAINSIQNYTQDMNYNQFLRDRKTRDAVVRNLEVIGEAIKSLPEDFRLHYPTVNWRGFAEMRDKLIHQYFGVDWEIVWKTLQKTIPDLKKQITIIIHEDLLSNNNRSSQDSEHTKKEKSK